MFTRTLVRWVGSPSCLQHWPTTCRQLIGYNRTALLRLIALYRNILQQSNLLVSNFSIITKISLLRGDNESLKESVQKVVT